MTDEDKTPATKEEARLALEKAYEAGRQAVAAEKQPEFRTFLNGFGARPPSIPHTKVMRRI